MLSWLKRRDRNRPSPQPQRRPGNGSFWLEGLALPLAAIALEALPLGAWLQLGAAWWVGDAAQAVLPTWGLFVLLFATFWLARWLVGRSIHKRWPPLLISLGWGLSILLAWYFRFYRHSGPLWQGAWLGALAQDFQTKSGELAGVIGLVLLLSYLWWRGLHLGRDPIEFEQISQRFKLGAGAVVLALLLIGTVLPAARSGLGAQLGFTLPVFLFVGLVALSLARLGEIRRTRRESRDPQANPTRSWMMALVVLSGGLVLLTLVIEQFFSYQTWLALIQTLQPVWDGVGTVLGWIVLALAFVLYWIFHPIVEGLKALFGGGQQQPAAPHPIGNPPPNLPHNGNAGGLPSEWLAVGQWVLIGLGVIILLLILRRALRAFTSWQQAAAEEEERESLGATRVLGGQLRGLLTALAARFQRRRPVETAAEQEAGRTVRALYRRVLRQAAMQGRGRRSAETPREFALRLRPLLEESAVMVPSVEGPSAQSGQPGERSAQSDASQRELEALTTTYEQARYGNQEPSPEQLRTLTEGLEPLLERLAVTQGGSSEPGK